MVDTTNSISCRWRNHSSRTKKATEKKSLNKGKVLDEYQKGFEKIEKKYEKKIKRYFYEQRKRALASLSELVKEKSNKKEFLVIDLIQELKDLQELEESILEEAYSYGNEFYANYFGGAGIVISPLKFNEIGEMPMRIKTIPKQILQNIIKQLDKTLREGISQGENISDLQKRVRAVYNMASNRALTIARTETGFGINQARVEIFRRNKVKKIKWLTAEDERVRKTHQLVDGEVREFGQKFSNGLRYPHDTLAPPNEVINCRCLAIPIDEFDITEEQERNELQQLTDIDKELEQLVINESDLGELRPIFNEFKNKLENYPELQPLLKAIRKVKPTIKISSEVDDTVVAWYKRRENQIEFNVRWIKKKQSLEYKHMYSTLYHELVHAANLHIDSIAQRVRMYEAAARVLRQYVSPEDIEKLEGLLHEWMLNRINDKMKMMGELQKMTNMAFSKSYTKADNRNMHYLRYAFTNILEFNAVLTQQKLEGVIKKNSLVDKLTKEIMQVIDDIY